MKIIGIDPGYDRLGIAIIEKTANNKSKKEIVLYSDCFTTSSKENIHERLLQIGAEISRILDKHKPDIMALETLFITKNQKTAMRVAESRGIVMYEAIKRGIQLFEYSPMQIKMAITSDGNSDKERIMKMVNLLVDLPKKKAKDDEYDAIAVALTCSAIHRSKVLPKKSGFVTN